MRVMDELTEANQRRTPSIHYAGGQSPRVGSCAGAVYQLIDWNLSKRFSSSKRIIAERPNQDTLYTGRDGGFTKDVCAAASKLQSADVHSVSKKTPALPSTPSPASVKSDATSKRSPGVVARLMGLESLPERTCNSSSKPGTPLDLQSDLTELQPREQLGPPPVLLQELLRLELQHSKRSFRDKLPGFAKKPVDPKSGGGIISAQKKPTVHSGERVRSNDYSRALRPSLPVQEDRNASVKQPFLARLHTGSPMLPSVSQNSPSPILSPSMLGGKNTVRLLEAAVKALEPIQSAPRRKYSLTVTDSHRGTPSDIGVSSRSEKRAITAYSYGRMGTSANSPSKSVRVQSGSRTGKDDRAVQSGHESSSPGSRSTSRARYESSRQVQARRTRYDKTLVASSRSVSPLQPHKSRTSNTKRMEDTPRPLLRTHEASIRGFKIDLSKSDSPLGKKLKKNDTHQEAVEPDVLPEKLSPTPSPNIDSTDAKRDSPEPYTPDLIYDGKANVSQISPSMSKIVPEKPASSGGFRSIRFRSKSGELEKVVGGQGNHVSPSDTHPVEKSIGLSPPKEAKVAGAGFSYSMLFSSRKQGNKKEGNEKGEALRMKRTDSTWMRYLLRRPSSIPWTSKSSKKVNMEVEEERIKPAEGVAHQDSSSQEPASSPTHQQLEKTKEGSNFVQVRYKSIDDIFPELPMEVKDASRSLPDLTKTIRAVEEQSLGFESHGDADYRSIERMFGRDFSITLMASSLTSPEMSPLENPAPETSPMSTEAFVTDCVVPGTFPNSPLARHESSPFSSRSQLNLHDMFEVVSGNHSHDSTGRRRSFCLSEPRERVLDDEEAAAESDTASNCAAFDTSGTPEHFENHTISVAAVWNEGVMTPPALRIFEEKLAHEGMMTPPALKKFEEKPAHESVMTPPVLKKFEENLAHEGVMTPPALKKFEEKLAQGFSDLDDSHVLCTDEFGQPSPVSVLQSPFLDEVPTTSDASLAELQQTDEDLHDVGDTELSAIVDDDDDDDDETEETNENMATSKLSDAAMPEMIQTDMIEQAILDISRIRNIDVACIGLEPQTYAPVEPQQEENYIREVLDAANLLRGDFPWHSAASPLNQSLFNRLEYESTKQVPSARSERRLLFDAVYEVMALEPWLKTSSFYVDLPMFPDLRSNSKFRSPISGKDLVREVHRMFSHWKDIAGNCLDDLVDYDMNVPEGRWVNFCHDVANVGLDIERTLLKVLIEEVVDDLTSLVATRSLTTS